MVADKNINLNIIRGQLEPEVQGFYCSCEQLQYRPIYCAEYKVKAKNTRLVTLFYPDGNEACPIEKIEASKNIQDTIITICLTNGEKLIIDENSL